MPVGIYPAGVAVSPDGTKVYVVNADGTFSIIDTTKNIVIAAMKVGNAPLVIGQFIGKGSAK